MASSRRVMVVSPKTRPEQAAYAVGVIFQVMAYVIIFAAVLQAAGATLAVLMGLAFLLMGRRLRERK